MLPLIIGSVLAVAGVAYVLMPLLRSATNEASMLRSIAPLATPESSAIEALREIEFDRATGKLSDDDYAALKAQYTPRALDELRAQDQKALNAESAELAESGRNVPTNSATAANSAFKADAVDPAEALISSIKSTGLVCPTDGPRPESDALFCSECGRQLVAKAPTSAAAAR